MKILGTVVVLATLIASPALAQSHNSYQLDRPWVGADGEIKISAARASALRECNAIANQYPEYDWGNMAMYQYRACMYEHHQVE